MGALDNTYVYPLRVHHLLSIFRALSIGVVVPAMLYGGMLSCCFSPARSSQSQTHLQCVQNWDLLLTTLPDILRIRWRCMSDSMHQVLITPAGECAVCLRPKLQMKAYACSITDFDIISDLGHVESSCRNSVQWLHSAHDHSKGFLNRSIRIEY
ncbi:uncharacterized protein F5891DRAFT_353530 [Suillus fuscotomentosus]|uniref:Uncharacterized protein n=1 Tax=Suillus fuscotomentosus TaxID=1912939 RepID=A0AAD4EJ13_9AGAM|nr:uncharacterized protein F5891DRAFT_353530 [Suillus fuscotomentosus]KAG1907025.1 hypothetical protein F5891DRAFT_353530 [Suillus fuscotomentosus]